MTRVPAHRRPKDPFNKRVPGNYIPPDRDRAAMNRVTHSYGDGCIPPHEPLPGDCAACGNDPPGPDCCPECGRPGRCCCEDPGCTNRRPPGAGGR